MVSNLTDQTAVGRRTPGASANGTATPAVNSLAYRNANPPPILSPLAPALAGFVGQWDVVQCCTSHEKSLAWILLDLKLGYFVPLQETRRKSGGRVRVRHVPIVPGYVFVNSADWQQTRWLLKRIAARTVLQFIRVTEQHALVRDLSAIHSAIANGHKLGGDFATPGRRCRVVSGPFEGMDAEVDQAGKHGRIFLTVALLGQKISFETDVDLLEPID